MNVWGKKHVVEQVGLTSGVVVAGGVFVRGGQGGVG
jgi:hypothetical protein